MAGPEGQKPHDKLMTVELDATQTPKAKVVAGRYQLIELIGAGGMGEIWLARDEMLGRKVAVKTLRRQLGDLEEFRRRLEFEARAAASLSHPNICAIFDYGDGADDPEHRPFIVMELIEGDALDAVIGRTGRLASAAVMDVVGQAARGLQAAHERGIVHRDVKPANLIVRPDGLVKITDFGIARAVQDSTATQTGMLVGTAHYMAPEQLRGGAATPASDIYALGVVGYTALAGRPPFVGEEPMAVAMGHVHEVVPPLPGDVAPAAAALVTAMLAKNPASRPPSAREVATVAAKIRRSLGRDTGPLTTVARAVAAGTSGEATRVVVPDSPTVASPRTEVVVAGAMGPEIRPVLVRQRLVRRLAIVVGALLLVALGIGLFWPGPALGDVPVPQLTGLAVAAATQQATRLGLHVQRQSVDGTTPAGQVVSQSIPAGTKVAGGSSVTITIASGDVELQAANYVGQPQDQVTSAISALGLTPTVSTVPTTSAPAGTVLTVTPTGRLALGSTVQVQVAAAPPPAGHGGDKKGPGQG